MGTHPHTFPHADGAPNSVRHEYVSAARVAELHQALISAFNRSALEQMVTLQLHRRLWSIASEVGNDSDVVLALIEWARETDGVGLHKLLAAALASHPQNPYLLNLQDKWTGIVFDAAPPCPYPGIQEYGIERNGEFYGPSIFFGRDKEVRDAITILSQHNILMVIGASGSGKSSLVLAGIVPCLRNSSAVGGAQPWKKYLFRPGAEPLSAFAEAVGCSQQTPEEIAAHLEAAAAESKVLIVIDQFEETYALAEKEDGAPLYDPKGVQRLNRQPNQVAAFETILIKLSELASIFLIIVMRDDFYPDFVHSRLYSLIPQHQRLEVPTLRDAALKDAICKPAQTVGAEVKPDLVTKLIEDGADGPGMLPFLQLTLVLLWDKAAGGPLQQSDYFSLLDDRQGQSVLVSVMALKANAALHAIREAAPRGGECTARRIFMRLIQFGEGRSDTRRRQAESSLRSKQDVDDEFPTVLNLLIKHRLLVASGSSSTTERSIDLAHDSLIQGWPTLRAWVEEGRQAEQERRSLEARAADWVTFGKNTGDLLSDARLADAEAWITGRAAEAVGYSALLESFITESRQAYNQRKNLQLMFNILLLIAVGVAVWGWYSAAFSADQARQNEQRAIVNQQAAENEAERARMQAQTAERSRQEAIRSKAEAETEKEGALKEQRRSNANKWAAMSDLERSLAQPNILKALQYAQRSVLATYYVDGYITPSADQALRNSVIAAAGNFSTMKLDFTVMSLDYSPSSKRVVLVSGSSGVVMLIDVYDGSLLKVFQGHSGIVRSGQFSPNAKSIVTAGDDGTIRMWDADTGEEVFIFLGHRGLVFDASFNPDGTVIASAGGDGTVRLWDVSTGREIRRLLGHRGSVYSARFSPDGSRLVSAGADGTVRIWETATGRQLDLRQFDSQINFAVFSPDGSKIAAAAGSRLYDQEFSAFVWTPLQLTSPLELVGHIRAVESVAFGADEQRLATVGDDGTARIWDVRSGVQLRHFGISAGFLNDVAFDPSNEKLIVAGDDGLISLLEPDATNALAAARIAERRIQARIDGDAEKPLLGYR